MSEILNEKQEQKLATRTHKRKWVLVALDILCLILVDVVLLVIYPSGLTKLTTSGVIIQSLLSIVVITGTRLLLGVYQDVWRFVSTSAYLRLVLVDFVAGWLCYIITRFLPFELKITFMRILAIVAMNLLCSLAYRLLYQWMYERAVHTDRKGILSTLLNMLFGYAGHTVASQGQKIRIAIVGAGRVGVALAEELRSNENAAYRPVCYIDVDHEKVGRNIHGVPVIHEDSANAAKLKELLVQEVVLALPQLESDQKQRLYNYYLKTGCKVKVYDYPVTQSMEGGRRKLREFAIEELLFRKSVELDDERTNSFYRDKTILISGGGGSIGSELCRQLATMKPKKLVVLDVYENAAYDIQQELKIAYGDKLDLTVEIISICDRDQLECVFERHHPNVVLHAAAHKHVPLMEHNCVEAVKNNVFGTLNMVEVSEKFGVQKFIMVSTDKAVNPTNVMGATKRMCEMIVQSRVSSATSFSATRFGNVLGSNGSVIPLFKRQIANGGPITLTDKRIIRYFMTIPEASQLVLTSGAMAKNGELYVLDMGKPVKILEMAENMIRLSGYEPYKDIQIIETGLRPGEKLYEELLIKTETLDKTDNELIFVEKDKPKDMEKLQNKLSRLREAVETGDDAKVRDALKAVVSTFRDPSDVNVKADGSEEMKQAFSVAG